MLNHLKGIKNSLKNSAPVIENIFELPLSDLEDFFEILVRDSFIWNELVKLKNAN